jgi:ATP-dependent protease ClpP protease subunit
MTDSQPVAEPVAAPTKDAPHPLNVSHVTKWIVEPFDSAAFSKAFAKHIGAIAEKGGHEQNSNRIYRAASAAGKETPILLVLHSQGGRIEPGYLISKSCKRLAKDKFVIAVPRKAESDARLLSLGADEIHMGLMSELL